MLRRGERQLAVEHTHADHGASQNVAHGSVVLSSVGPWVAQPKISGWASSRARTCAGCRAKPRLATLSTRCSSWRRTAESASDATPRGPNHDPDPRGLAVHDRQPQRHRGRDRSERDHLGRTVVRSGDAYLPQVLVTDVERLSECNRSPACITPPSWAVTCTISESRVGSSSSNRYRRSPVVRR